MTAPADPYELFQYHMIHGVLLVKNWSRRSSLTWKTAHATFKLGYEVILPLLDKPPTNDLQNFLGYCEAWANAIASHHDSEASLVTLFMIGSEYWCMSWQDEILFPFLNVKMDFSGEAAHKILHESLDKLLSMIHDARADPSKFDPGKMSSFMMDLKEPLVCFAS